MSKHSLLPLTAQDKWACYVLFIIHSFKKLLRINNLSCFDNLTSRVKHESSVPIVPIVLYNHPSNLTSTCLIYMKCSLIPTNSWPQLYCMHQTLPLHLSVNVAGSDVVLCWALSGSTRLSGFDIQVSMYCDTFQYIYKGCGWTYLFYEIFHDSVLCEICIWLLITPVLQLAFISLLESHILYLVILVFVTVVACFKTLSLYAAHKHRWARRSLIWSKGKCYMPTPWDKIHGKFRRSTRPRAASVRGTSCMFTKTCLLPSYSVSACWVSLRGITTC